MENRELIVDRKREARDKLEQRRKDREKHIERKLIKEPMITVDQLSAYRRKKSAITLPTDNLHLPEGIFKIAESEYQHCYKKFDPFPVTILFGKPETDSLKLEGEYEFQTEYDKSYILLNSVSYYRPQLIRRCTNLKLEGISNHLTEYKNNFKEFLHYKKGQLQRKATTLKLVGQMNLVTENQKNFIYYKNVFRPPLCKKLTNLHLSGSLHMDTESRENFLEYKLEKPHPLKKMQTNLHLEGPLLLQPEYSSAFVQYENYQRLKPSMPQDRIKSPMEFANENNSRLSTLHPFIPYLRSYLDQRSDLQDDSKIIVRSRSHSVLSPEDASRTELKKSPRPSRITDRKKNNDGNYRTTVVSNWVLEKRSQSVGRDPNPWRNHHELDGFNNKAMRLQKHHQGVWTSWRSKSSSPKMEGRFECQPEYRRAYIDYITRERTLVRPDGFSSNKEVSIPTVARDSKRYRRPTASSPPMESMTNLDAIETLAFGKKCYVGKKPSPDSKSRKTRIQTKKQNIKHVKYEPTFLIVD